MNVYLFYEMRLRVFFCLAVFVLHFFSMQALAFSQLSDHHCGGDSETDVLECCEVSGILASKINADTTADPIADFPFESYKKWKNDTLAIIQKYKIFITVKKPPPKNSVLGWKKTVVIRC